MAEGGIPPEPIGLAPLDEPLVEGGILPEPKGSTNPEELVAEGLTPPAELLAEGGILPGPKGSTPTEELMAEGLTPPAELLAEGWIPPEPQGPPPPDRPPRQPQVEEIDSLHLLFSRDLLDYVIRRKRPAWTFSSDYSNPCPVTPFSYRVRLSLDCYLNKECVNFETLYHFAFIDEHPTYDGYVRVIKFLVRSVYCKTKTYTDLLRLIFLCSQFTLLAYDRGVAMAPYYALFAVKDLLSDFCKTREIIPDYFYGTLGPIAQTLVHENTPIVFYETYQR